jgi:hypothetical protein
MSKTQFQAVGGKTNGAMRHAYGLLASAETGSWPTWTGSTDEERRRAEVLAVLLDVISRSDVNRLSDIAQAWVEQFPTGRPVSALELRRSARAFLSRSDAGEAKPTDSNFRRALSLAKRSAWVNGPAPPEPASDGIDEAEAEQQCAVGLNIWFEHLTIKDQWSKLPATVPGESPIDIEKVYVELYAVSDQDARDLIHDGGENSSRTSRRRLAGEHPVVTVPMMVSRTLRRCVVMGEPGSGKSTLIQWLVWAVHRGKCPDFDAAIVVRLRDFATSLAEDPNLSLLHFFFDSLRTAIFDWKPAVHRLRQIAAESHRVLLLLDGWDEVPVTMREQVREQIVAEQKNFVTVITSRPSGLPRQLDDGGHVDFYHIAGLTTGAIEELVGNLLASSRRTDQFESIVKRLREEPDLRELAANPFLLGLLVRILSDGDSKAKAPQTLADIYRQMTRWMQEQYRRVANASEPLTVGHIAGLRQLSHRLLFELDAPRYWFWGQELAEALAGSPIEPADRSRFINRTDPVFDKNEFLHATFQEFFAAEHVTTLSDQEVDQFLERAFHSASRLIVLEFLAGLGDAVEAKCRAKAASWFRRRDRFSQIVLRLARLASAGRWGATDVEGLALREELWSEIRANADMPLVKAAAEAFAQLDARELARRARRATGLDNWAIQCIVDAVPPSVVRSEKLFKLMAGEWGEYGGFEVRGGATSSEIDSIRAALADPQLAPEKRRTAIIHAGAARDRGSVPALLEILTPGAFDDDIQAQAIDSLGAIGGREAIDGLVEIVLGERNLAEELVSMAVQVLRNVGGTRGALDPVGRDRLVRRLAALPPDDLRLERILSALEGHPLRDGASLIGEFAGRLDGTTAIRVAAIQVLATVMDQQPTRAMTATIDAEVVEEVANAILNLAVARTLPVPMKWLEAKVLSARHKVRKREFLTAFLLLLPGASGNEHEDATGFLHRCATQALRDESASSEELAELLDQAMTRAKRASTRFFPDAMLPLALDALARFERNPESIAKKRVACAASIVAHFGNPATRRNLRAAFDAALRLPEPAGRDTDQLRQFLANTLAEIAPGDLLSDPRDCTFAQSALRTLSVRRGWLVFDDRIIDSEGREIANAGVSTGPRIAAEKAIELKDLLDQLPEQMRSVLVSYWLMVKNESVCRSSDSFKSIYRAMVSRICGDVVDNLSPHLEMIYLDQPPNFENWRKTLTRIQRRFAGHADSLAVLRRIGLCRRSQRP